MSQDTILILLLILVAYIISGMRKSHKHEIKPMQPPKIPASSAHVKPTPIKPQEAVVAWEKKDSSSRGKRILNRSRLRQSILTSEILGKKY
ncbi:hypothetical protein RHABOEDO_000919 [Candidatus Rhabdochlamydia oedothoracis]|uniref:Uncharacterized protein n=1 Tax=Candidatus Rhabdochlamydia oedothoracis TaxID=2720720 RepID=A0ABX8V6R7_9BACT|nr:MULTISPECIES: hypothetical protein [Rhabdochlamydia]KAG6559868.1 hypothetical protein RHOW815_000139 [Candidatus Rhabdochlamydia sp. W815]MCL6755923.1 hypothetical protein [Candidatus Rhabdochlamydia oedothoracis]QYF48715.1 hypothetical protein RHABOEDO_000919 [Candidatus Rhabdochlamydia oedothoracis]